MPALALQAAPAAASPAAARPAAAHPPASRFGAALEARLTTLQAHRPVQAGPATPQAMALRAVEAAQARLDAVLSAARSGRTFSAAELLGLQAEAYRLTQTLDVAGKLVEHGVQGVKQAVQTQV